MILITTALRAEARPIIDGLGLKGINTPFDVYLNDDCILIITGVGSIKSATGVGWAFGNYANITGAVNIGTAGGNLIEVGKTVIANAVELHRQNYVQIPDILYHHELSEYKCVTSDNVVKNVDECEPAVYDMEAYGFMSAAGNFLTNDKIAVLKVVSDDINNNIIPTSEEISCLMRNQFAKIRDFLQAFEQYCKKTDNECIIDTYKQEITKKYKLTKTRSAVLKDELHNAYVYCNCLPDLNKLPLPQGDTKKYNTLAFECFLSNLKNNIGCVNANLTLPKNVYRKFFEHIYIEKDIFDDEKAKKIISRFPDAKIVKVPHYKAVFNRNKQNFSNQQCGKNLIIAKAAGNLLYKGSDYCNAFGFDKFYYCSTVMGCLYSCEYCYLQGMYPSANIVAFVNTQDFFDEITISTRGEKALVCCSYDSDILALDPVLETVASWLEFAKNNPNVTLEIRTKSANIAPFDREVLQNVIIAYTVSPESVCRQYEKMSPTLQARLKAANKLAVMGWRVRLCIEPVLVPIVSESEYVQLANKIIEYSKTVVYEDIAVGEFRMNKSCYAKIATQRYYSKLFHNPFARNDGEYVSYENSKAAVNNIAELLRKNTDRNIIVFEYGL